MCPYIQGPISISWFRDGEKAQYRWQLSNFYIDSQHGILDFPKNFNRVFFEMHKNGNNANIGIRAFITWKQKFQ